MEALVDASKMQGALSHFLIGVSPPSASGTLPDFRGAQKHEMQGVTLAICSYLLYPKTMLHVALCFMCERCVVDKFACLSSFLIVLVGQI